MMLSGSNGTTNYSKMLNYSAKLPSYTSIIFFVYSNAQTSDVIIL